MMHRCSSSHGNMMGACTCGSFHSQSNSSCMLFSMANHKPYDESDMYYYYTPSSTSVDCTLSLGTPSTRFTEEEERRSRHDQRRSGNCVSNFCWDLLQPKNSSYSQSHSKPNRGTNCVNSNNDPLVARRCANCDTTSTPLWRNGPSGPKSLCNACGIRFKKEERRASAAGTTMANNAASSGGNVMEFSNQNSSWYSHSQNQKMPCLSPAMGNEFHFVNDGDRDSENGISFLSWRLNVTDRPFTR